MGLCGLPAVPRWCGRGDSNPPVAYLANLSTMIGTLLPCACSLIHHGPAMPRTYKRTICACFSPFSETRLCVADEEHARQSRCRTWRRSTLQPSSTLQSATAYVSSIRLLLLGRISVLIGILGQTPLCNLHRHPRLRIPGCEGIHVGQDQLPRAVAAEGGLVLLADDGEGVEDVPRVFPVRP